MVHRGQDLCRSRFHRRYRCDLGRKGLTGLDIVGTRLPLAQTTGLELSLRVSFESLTTYLFFVCVARQSVSVLSLTEFFLAL